MRTDPPIRRDHTCQGRKCGRDSNYVYCLQFHSATGSRAAFPDDDPEWRDWAWELVSAQKASSSFTGAEERKETEPDQPRQEVGAKRARLASDDAPTGELDIELLLEEDTRSKRTRGQEEVRPKKRERRAQK